MIQASGTSSSLDGVQFLTASTGYVIGDHATILKTTNGGASWTSIAPSSVSATDTARYLNFIDANTGWIVMAPDSNLAPCYLLSTTDGGQTWAKQDLPSTSDYTYGFDSIKGVKFADATHGYLYGTAMSVTSDGGKTWTVQPGLSYLSGCFTFGAAAVATGAQISSYAPDLGWVQGAHFDRSNNLFAFVDPNTAWIVSGTDLERTTDAGKTITSLGTLGTVCAAIGFCDADDGVILSSYGSIITVGKDASGKYKTHDLSLPNDSFSALSVVDPSDAWIVGSKGQIVRYVVR